MNEALRQIPEKYARYMVPYVFEPFAKELVGQVTQKPTRALDIAAGTGVVARLLRSGYPDCEVIAVDTSASMLLQGTSTNAKVRGDVHQLPFKPESFDLAACGFGMMFFGDKIAALKEIHRIVRSGGQFLATVWDSLDKNPLPRLIDEVARSFFPGNPPPFFEVPFSYFERETIEGDLAFAGFSEVEVEPITVQTSGSAESYAIGFLEGNPIVKKFLSEDGELLPRIRETVGEKLAREFGDPVHAQFRGIVARGRA